MLYNPKFFFNMLNEKNLINYNWFLENRICDFTNLSNIDKNNFNKIIIKGIFIRGLKLNLNNMLF